MALLGKQAWHLLTKPSTLVASTFLPKYCKNEPFIKVKSKPCNSWIWKSLLTERDVISMGIDVQVWSGKQTTLLAGKFALGINPSLESHMCQHTHIWKTPTCHEETMVLQQKAFSILGGNDRIVWKFNMSGEFSVSSTYWVLTNENQCDIT